MWIKTQSADLVNLNFVFAFQIENICGEFIVVAYKNLNNSILDNGSTGVRIAAFDTEDEAQKLVDKLAEKLGAEVIDFDN